MKGNLVTGVSFFACLTGCGIKHRSYVLYFWGTTPETHISHLISHIFFRNGIPD